MDRYASQRPKSRRNKVPFEHPDQKPRREPIGATRVGVMIGVVALILIFTLPFLFSP